MIVRKKVKYKTVRLHKPRNDRCGAIRINGKKPEPHEEETIKCLSEFGFDVETIIPSNVPGSRNPDILMMGTFWEMKGPRTTDNETIATRFRRAVKQSGGKGIFDLRFIKAESDVAEVEKTIMNLFMSTRGMRRIMIIKRDTDGDSIILDNIK